MSDNLSSRPIYDAKADRILKALVEKSREDVAEELGYSSFKSLDMYMRRRNFIWDSRKANYIPAVTRLEAADNSYDPIPIKAAMVISVFDDGITDPRAAAKHAGFMDHREMADYMKRKGYIWSDARKNYVLNKTSIENEEATPDSFSPDNSSGFKPDADNFTASMRYDTDISRYLPLLEALEKNKERLLRMLIPDSQVGVIPKFAVPGVPRTKSIYMSDMLCRLLKEFSEEKNLSIREIVEASIIEYLRRYGFESEVDTLLRRC